MFTEVDNACADLVCLALKDEDAAKRFGDTMRELACSRNGDKRFSYRAALWYLRLAVRRALRDERTLFTRGSGMSFAELAGVHASAWWSLSALACAPLVVKYRRIGNHIGRLVRHITEK